MSGDGGNPPSLRDLLGAYEKSGLERLSTVHISLRFAICWNAAIFPEVSTLIPELRGRTNQRFPYSIPDTRFFKRRISTEACLRRHRHFRAAYKIEACVVPGESKFLCDGHSVSYSRAAIFLCIKNSIGDIDRVRAWESAEHKVSNDAEKVLASECQRLSKLIGKRIELIWFDKDKNEYFVREVFNPNDSQYWLEETNL